MLCRLFLLPALVLGKADDVTLEKRAQHRVLNSSKHLSRFRCSLVLIGVISFDCDQHFYWSLNKLCRAFQFVGSTVKSREDLGKICSKFVSRVEIED